MRMEINGSYVTQGMKEAVIRQTKQSVSSLTEVGGQAGVMWRIKRLRQAVVK